MPSGIGPDLQVRIEVEFDKLLDALYLLGVPPKKIYKTTTKAGKTRLFRVRKLDPPQQDPAPRTLRGVYTAAAHTNRPIISGTISSNTIISGTLSTNDWTLLPLASDKEKTEAAKLMAEEAAKRSQVRRRLSRKRDEERATTMSREELLKKDVWTTEEAAFYCGMSRSAWHVRMNKEVNLAPYPITQGRGKGKQNTYARADVIRYARAIGRG